MTQTVKQAAIISDANVLIDYAKSAPNILRLISTQLRKLYVALPVLREVYQLNKSDIARLGIEIVEPTLAQLTEADHVRRINPAVSGEDAICFVIARDNNWACLTNDIALRKYCRNNTVACQWGIGIMHHLVAAGKLTPQKALNIAQNIQSKNKYISVDVIKRFRKQLGL